jgi:hypothetical protein
MFRREIYRAMATVLDALDAEALLRRSCYFGGGTRIALAHDEYRLSRDLDFLCSDREGYADLRYSVREKGYKALFVAPDQAGLELAPRDDLRKTATRFLEDPVYQERCFQGLDVRDGEPVLAGVRALLDDLDVP